MSLDMYRRQIDRLTREIADLEAKVADHNARAAKERAAALASASSIRPSSNPSTIRSKLAEQVRREKSAAEHDKKAATFSGRIATKRQALTSAQVNAKRAEAAERRKDEQAIDRRRREDVRHVEDLERRRREAMRPLIEDIPMVDLGRRRVIDDPRSGSDGYLYDVCLSFAGEQRGYVELVATELKGHGLRVFYDAEEQVTLWGKDLAEHLDRVYRVESRYCVMFISKEYAEKAWTRWERRSALARAMEEEAEYVLPARFDDTELPGLRPSIAYLPLREIAPAGLADLIFEKVTGEPAPDPYDAPGSKRHLPPTADE